MLKMQFREIDSIKMHKNYENIVSFIFKGAIKMQIYRIIKDLLN